MNRIKLAMWICVLLSALMMSLPWLVPHCGGLALIGLVPLLCAEHFADINGVRRFRIWHYSFFVLWNAITTWWVANATLGGAIFAILANALQMSLVFGLFRLGKRYLRGILPYIFLAVAWIAWERWYLQSAQISWPWLVLGNAFAQSTRSIQWYEFTGTLGGSAWVWACNITIFLMIKAFMEGDWAHWNGKARAAAVVWVLSIFVLPYAASGYIYRHYEEVGEGQVNVIIGQPNFDPYEKFSSKSQAEQTAELLSLYRRSCLPCMSRRCRKGSGTAFFWPRRPSREMSSWTASRTDAASAASRNSSRRIPAQAFFSEHPPIRYSTSAANPPSLPASTATDGWRTIIPPS